MGEHRCGPTVEQVQDALMRGDTLGTWPRCAECAAKEKALMEKFKPFIRPRVDPSANGSPEGAES